METLYTPEDLAEVLKVNIDTVRRYLRARRIPGAFRMGTQWRVPESAVHAFIRELQKASEAETPEEGSGEPGARTN